MTEFEFAANRGSLLAAHGFQLPNCAQIIACSRLLHSNRGQATCSLPEPNPSPEINVSGTPEKGREADDYGVLFSRQTHGRLSLD
jgi:hypothetical protein